MEIKIDNKSLEPLIDAQIQAAIVQVLSTERGDLVSRVVADALGEKVGSFDRRTKFQAAVHTMIQEAAKETFKVWLDENKAKIKAAIEARLKKSPQKFVNQIADKLLDGLAGSFHVSCKLKYEDD